MRAERGCSGLLSRAVLCSRVEYYHGKYGLEYRARLLQCGGNLLERTADDTELHYVYSPLLLS